MIKYSALFLLLFVGLFSCNKKPEDVVTDVKKKCAAINRKLNDYTPKTVDDIVSKSKGTINGYYRSEEIKKIISEHYTDTDRVFTEYYFDDGMLIFISSQDFKYNCSDTITEEKAKARNDSVWYDDKKTKLEISRFYFNKNKLVMWIMPDGKEVAPATANFIDKESILWGETAILIKELKETP